MCGRLDHLTAADPPPAPLHKTHGQWGLKLLLFFCPERRDDKDSIPLGLLTPGCTAEVVVGVGSGVWGGLGGLGRGLIQKINPMEFSPHCKWRFVAFALLSQPIPHNASVSLNRGSQHPVE